MTGAKKKKTNNFVVLPKTPRDKLGFAAKHGDLEAVKSLLEINREDIDQVSCMFQHTPLQVAAEAGHRRVVELLLDLGANVNQTNLNGLTPLMSAVLGGNPAIVRLFFERGADVHAVSSGRYNAIMLAASRGKLKIFQMCLEWKPDLEQISCMGQNALMLAAWGGHAKVVRLLLDSSVDLSVRDSNGRTVLEQIEFRKDRTDITQMLRDEPVRRLQQIKDKKAAEDKAITDAAKNAVTLRRIPSFPKLRL